MKFFRLAIAAGFALTTLGASSAPAASPNIILASAPPTVTRAAYPGDTKRGTTLLSLPVATVSDDVTPAGSLAVAEVSHNASLGPVTNITKKFVSIRAIRG